MYSFCLDLCFIFIFPGPEMVQKLWGLMADKLLEAIVIEPDTDIHGIMMDSLCKVGIGSMTFAPWLGGDY